MDVLKWINVIDKKMTSLNVEPNLCTHLISPKSTCRSCVEHCPTKSISFSNKQIEIEDNCLNCGLCSTVCPTGALMLNRPPLTQVISTIVQQCEQHDQVYVHCERMPVTNRSVAAVSVPCLGMIPKEAWVTVLSKCQNLSIYHFDTVCSRCEITSGEKIWKQELHVGEKMMGSSIKITSTLPHSTNKEQYDIERRAFLSNFLNEFKATNKLALKELVGSPDVPSYQEKRQEDSLLKVKREWEGVSQHIFEKMTNESAYPYMNKQSFLLNPLQENEALQKQKDIRLPVITSDCNFCGACTTLCPTEALKMEKINNRPSITLHPVKCVDCSLCEDICFTKSIGLQYQPNGELLNQKRILAPSS